MISLLSGAPRAVIISAIVAVGAATMFGSSRTAHAQSTDMLVRISEIEISSGYLEEYQRILQEEAAESIRVEPGVLCIFPSFQQDAPTQIRILEIYASRAAYELHIKSPHFQKYKAMTLKMVKSLKLVDMRAIDPIAMPFIFKKMKGHP